jgi:ABC-type amino acid transport substrate-binding protein
MLRLFVFFLYSFLFSTISFGRTFNIGFFDLYPHIIPGSASHSEASGPAITYFTLIAADMKLDLNISKEAMAIPRLLKMLEEGTLDAAVALGRNPEREKICLFPEKPFFMMRPALMVMKTSPLLLINSVTDLRKLSIGTYAEGFISPLMKNPGIKIDPLNGGDVVFRNYQKMELGRIDAVYSPDSQNLIKTAKEKKFSNNIRIIYLPEPPIGLFTAFSKKVNPSIVKRYNGALKKMKLYNISLD